MTSLQKILAITLALQVVLAGIIFWSQRRVAAESGDLLGEFEVEGVAALTVEDSDGNSVELRELDGAWVLASGGNYPADQDAVRTFLEKLGAIQTNRLVTRTADSHKRLQVDEEAFGHRVKLELDDGTVYELLLGSSPNPRSIHVRLADQNEVFSTGEILAHEVSTAVSSWIDPTYVNLNRDQVSAMTLENANGTFELRKTGDEWALLDLDESEEFDPAGANSLLGQLTTLRMVAPLGTEERPEYGLDNPLAVLAVTVQDEEGSQRSHTLAIGTHDPETDTYVMKWSESDYYATVARFSGDRMIDTSREDFITEPPADDAEATPESEQPEETGS